MKEGDSEIERERDGRESEREGERKRETGERCR